MEKRILIDKYGGPDVISFDEFEIVSPLPNEVTVRHTAIGVNFIDTYHRSGLYPIELPGLLGLEATGVVEAVGSLVKDYKIGDRVCTFGPKLGAYSTVRNFPADSLFQAPDDVSDEILAASLLKGCTAEFLLLRCANVKRGETVLVHAAAGGVGLFLVQWLKILGAVVIGTVGNDEKAELAKSVGADHVFVGSGQDVSKMVLDVTDGKGVDVTLDGVGKSSWETSLQSTKKRGLIVSYGNASGAIDGISLGTLASHGSLFVTRPTLFDYYTSETDRADGSSRLFQLLRDGMLTVTIGQRFALADASQAHRIMEARATIGSTLLIP